MTPHSACIRDLDARPPERARSGMAESKPIEITSITENLVQAVRDFNVRLDSGGAPREFRFPEDHIPGWPKVDDRQLYEEYFALLENGDVRGCYILRRQEFSFYGAIRPIGFWHWPISEGMVNNKYSWVLLRMLGTVLKDQPLLYGLAPTDRMRNIWMALSWSVWPVPFYFRVNHHGRFLKEIRALRKTRAHELMLDIGARAGIGQLGLKILQGARARRSALKVARAEAIQGFSDWANDLWKECNGRYAMIARRDSETLNIVYPANSQKYLCYKVTRNKAVVGWAVLLDTQMADNKYFGNLRVGSIVDCLASPENASGVIRAATKVLEARGVDLIVSNQSHAAWCLGLRDAGFLQGPSNYPFFTSRDLTKLLNPLQTTMAHCHFTRGDGDGPIHL